MGKIVLFPPIFFLTMFHTLLGSVILITYRFPLTLSTLAASSSSVIQSVYLSIYTPIYLSNYLFQSLSPYLFRFFSCFSLYDSCSLYLSIETMFSPPLPSHFLFIFPSVTLSLYLFPHLSLYVSMSLSLPISLSPSLFPLFSHSLFLSFSLSLHLSLSHPHSLRGTYAFT